ncbi:tyrosine-type recombinase/integrase [Streptomyces sp. NPDC005065]|uniref:tyrosine-type recombinase/integrase n=1 Tax=Streptomyces sp. NPDC005065 TaxID=3154461 RepID=UPI0033BBC8DB
MSGDEVGRDLAALVVARSGGVVETGDLWEPYRLVDQVGETVVAVSEFLRELQAAGRAAATQRSYALDLLRWFRFLQAVEVQWGQATRVEARDFCRWLAVVEKPRRGAGPAGVANLVTGKRSPGRTYAVSTLAHSETVLRSFYDFHQEAGSGPMVNPFPLVRERRDARAHAHHSPMELFRNERAGRYRPTLPQRIPRRIPDERFNQLFAQLGSNRDRALVALWVSTGARASELLGASCGDIDPGRQLVTVVRKGSRAVQQLPASPDAFVWLRLYQSELDPAVSTGRDDPLWWTLRRPWRQLTYHAARAMFVRANAALGANWSLHDLRHTAAHRMARDPNLPLTDVQWVLGHVHLSTTQLYLTPAPDEVISEVLAHHRRQAAVGATPPGRVPPSAGYRPETMETLFEGRSQ